ncbi:MAG: HAD hydrolase-like protein [Acholeplasmatales bacterium]|nr:HAD hydrolase-like protein [Acholeplasmatales bacterium]
MDAKLENILKNKRAYIFDLDGTLADSEKLQWEAHKLTLKKMFNVDLDNEHIYTYLGLPEPDLFMAFEKDFNFSMGGEKGYEKYAKARMKTAAKIVLKEAEPFRYVNEVLANTGLGIRFCLVTAQNKDLVKKMLKKWNYGGSFNERNIYYCDKGRNKAFYYDYFFKNVVKNAKPEEVILFEDVNKWLKEGKARGFTTVGIDNNFGNEQLEADLVVKTQDIK